MVDTVLFISLKIILCFFSFHFEWIPSKFFGCSHVQKYYSICTFWQSMKLCTLKKSYKNCPFYDTYLEKNNITEIILHWLSHGEGKSISDMISHLCVCVRERESFLFYQDSDHQVGISNSRFQFVCAGNFLCNSCALRNTFWLPF